MRTILGVAVVSVALLAMILGGDLFVLSCAPSEEEERAIEGRGQGAAVPSPIITIATKEVMIGPHPGVESLEFTPTLAERDVLVKCGYTANPFPGTNWNPNRDRADLAASVLSVEYRCGEAVSEPLMVQSLGPRGLVTDVTHDESKESRQIWFRNDPDEGVHRQETQLLYRFPPCGESGEVSFRIEANEEVAMRISIYQERIEQ